MMRDMSTLANPDLPTTAMVGVGSMGGAILQGLLAPGVPITTPIRVTTNSEESAAALRDEDTVVAHSVERNPEANRVAVRGARLVIVGVKPWMVHEVLTEISADLAENAIVISVAAGVTIGSMQRLLPSGVTVLRAMPNTPSLVGAGVTGVVGAESSDEEALELATRLFATVGEVITVDTEEQLDKLSAISGSGPAYVFMFIEKFVKAAVRLGFSYDDARRMVEGTFLGSSQLLEAQGTDPEILRKNVTSPKGTTEQAMNLFLNADLDGLIDQALAAAIARAQELANETV